MADERNEDGPRGTVPSMPAAALHAGFATRVDPGAFRREAHVYRQVAGKRLHPVARAFFDMPQGHLVQRFARLHPRVEAERLLALLRYEASFLRWAGGDLLQTATRSAVRQMVLLEMNSCPSGNKSMPLREGAPEDSGYRTVLENALLPKIPSRESTPGALGILFDKNWVEVSGYAAVLADLTQEAVYLVPCPEGSAAVPVEAGFLLARDAGGASIPLRAALRYVTQRPWTRIPLATRTVLLNPIAACLAGGRNKLVAAKAYDYFNAGLAGSGLAVRTPETLLDVTKNEVPFLVERFGGQAVVKMPYSNAGQDVFTITNADELAAFMARPERYDRFIVQSLIGGANWSSRTRTGTFFQVGTMPNADGAAYAADLRMMICASPGGYLPVAAYARRAHVPLSREAPEGLTSWPMLGTNLSTREADGGWCADSERLITLGEGDFDQLGLGLDDLIEAFIQTVLGAIAIDHIAKQLIGRDGSFDQRRFASLNDDAALLRELTCAE